VPDAERQSRRPRREPGQEPGRAQSTSTPGPERRSDRARHAPDPERRSDRARKAILTAALELSQDPGFLATSVEAIARRAGVGKQTIYRWWPSKGAVVLDAIDELAEPALPYPDTGDIVADLNSQMSVVASLLSGTVGQPFAGLIAAAQSDPALSKGILERIFEPRVIACRERLAAAQRAGQLRADADLDEVIELLYGPLYYRLMFRNAAITPRQPAQILGLTFGGLRPAANPDPANS